MVIFPIVTHAQRATLAVAIVSGTLAVVAVFLRLLAQRVARKKWNTSDYLLIMACVSSASYRGRSPPTSLDSS